MKLELSLSDGNATIRWGLNHLDFKKIRDIVSKNYFDSLEKEYHYELLPYVGTKIEYPKGPQTFIGNVRCIQGIKAARIEFICSEQFAGNMEWLKLEVRCTEHVKHLLWENF
ncbi:hypothetical protein LC085_06590 [Bacillus tianshenii]|uniref:hypothetical protein n=1 Tax=Sutcliffiella tianshenii TaxID=1463404 RepID=UPI001CD69540|nr:hypothetical protein [Bacillus tianshenii]MCA1319577.1 hypothetical protein [Bacillus tianshenii]